MTDPVEIVLIGVGNDWRTFSLMAVRYASCSKSGSARSWLMAGYSWIERP